MVVFGADRKLQIMIQDDIARLVRDAVENPAAFGRLYDSFIQRIYRYVYSRVGTSPEAEDITSQTFIAAYESLGRYREQGQFSVWLFRIARSKMNEHFRRSRREVGLDAAERIVEVDDALGSLIQNEELARLRFLIKKINDDERELLRLRYVAELSFAEMAEVLDKREDAVKKSVYRLLERLKGQME